MENDNPVIVLGQPTVKDQLIGAGIAIGSTIVMLLVFAGFGKLVDAIDTLRAKRRAKKLAKAQLLLDKETKPE